MLPKSGTIIKNVTYNVYVEILTQDCWSKRDVPRVEGKHFLVVFQKFREQHQPNTTRYYKVYSTTNGISNDQNNT